MILKFLEKFSRKPGNCWISSSAKKNLSKEFQKVDDNDNDNDNDNNNDNDNDNDSNEEEERNKDRENEHGIWTTYPLKTLCLSYHYAQTMTASLPQRFIDDVATIVISL